MCREEIHENMLAYMERSHKFQKEFGLYDGEMLCIVGNCFSNIIDDVGATSKTAQKAIEMLLKVYEKQLKQAEGK